MDKGNNHTGEGQGSKSKRMWAHHVLYQAAAAAFGLAQEKIQPSTPWLACLQSVSSALWKKKKVRGGVEAG